MFCIELKGCSEVFFSSTKPFIVADNEITHIWLDGGRKCIVARKGQVARSYKKAKN